MGLDLAKSATNACFTRKQSSFSLVEVGELQAVQFSWLSVCIYKGIAIVISMSPG